MLKKYKFKNSEDSIVNAREINLLAIFVLIYENRQIVFLGTILGVFLSLTVYFLMPDYYTSSTKFALEKPESEISSQYSRLFGRTDTSQMLIIKAFFETRTLKNMVSQNFQSQFLNETLIDAFQKKSFEVAKKINLKNANDYKNVLIQNYIIKKLNLKKVTLINQDQYFLLEYKSKQRDLVKPVLEAYLNAIRNFLIAEKIVSVKKLFVLIEPPRDVYFKQKKSLMILMLIGFFLGLVFSCVAIIFVDILHSTKIKWKIVTKYSREIN